MIVILTGASGSGKTTIADAVRTEHDGIEVFHSDGIGVPSRAEMMATHGSLEAWQRAKTFEWLERLAPLGRERSVLFEGQMRIAFIAEAARRAQVRSSQIVLIDCDDATRARRLAVDREQPALAGSEMMAWAAFLRQEARVADLPVIDTTFMSLPDSIAAVLAHCGTRVRPR